jgi:hypothetical protein
MKIKHQKAKTKIIPASIKVISPETVTIELTRTEADILRVIIGNTNYEYASRKDYNNSSIQINQLLDSLFQGLNTKES